MMNRRVFLGSALTAVALSQTRVARAAEQKAIAQTTEPLVWPVITRQVGIRSFDGHTDTVPDIVGRIGIAASLVIFSEGNHFMALLSEEIVGAFPTWGKAQPQYADLSLDNVVVVTMPQPIVVQMVRTGAVALGSLTLDMTRASGLYPDIVMGGPAPLQELRKLGVLEPRAGNRAAIEGLIGKAAADAFFAKEVEHFPGRLGITHRDVPEMLARGYADVGLTQYHLISYWARIFPNHFELVPIAGGDRFPAQIAFGRIINPLRPRALKAFEEFFFSRARDVYPRYDFARMTDEEYGATLVLD